MRKQNGRITHFCAKSGLSGTDPIADSQVSRQTKPMIERDEMFAPMLEADPSFIGQWQTFLADYSDEPDLPQYLALGDLALHLIDRMRRGDIANFDKVFEVVERWHIDGDEYVQEAATVGFLESIQNHLGGNDRFKGDGGVRASDFEPYLGPETRKWWDKLYRFWEGDSSALRFDT